MSHFKQEMLTKQDQIQITQTAQKFLDQTNNTIQMIIDYIEMIEKMEKNNGNNGNNGNNNDNNNNGKEEKNLEWLNFRATQGLNMYNLSSQGLYESKYGEKGIQLGMSRVHAFIDEIKKQKLSEETKKRLDPMINYMISCLQNKRPAIFAPPKLSQFNENVVSNGMSCYLSSQHKISEKDEMVKKDYQNIQSDHDLNIEKNKKNIQDIKHHKVHDMNNVVKSSLQDVNHQNVDHDFRQKANNSSCHDEDNLNHNHKHNHKKSNSLNNSNLPNLEEYYENEDQMVTMINYMNEVFDILSQYPLNKLFKKFDVTRLQEIKTKVNEINKEKKLSNQDGMQID